MQVGRSGPGIWRADAKAELTVTLGQQLPTRSQELAGRGADPGGAESAGGARRVCGPQAPCPAMGSTPRGGRGSRTGPGSSDTLGASKPGPREGFGMCQACRTDGGRGQVSPSRSPRLHRAASPGRCLCPWWSPSRSCCSLGQPWLTPRSRGAGVRRAHAKARSKAVETAVVGSQESPAQRRNRSWGHL